MPLQVGDSENVLNDKLSKWPWLSWIKRWTDTYGILQSFVPHSLHSFNDFILLFIHSFPIHLPSHSFSYSSTLTVIPFNLTISLWQENETLSWIAKTSKNGHFCVTTLISKTWGMKSSCALTLSQVWIPSQLLVSYFDKKVNSLARGRFEWNCR